MTNEELVQLYQAGDKLALNKLIEQNIGMVRKLTYRFKLKHNKSIDSEDLIQEGIIGLIIAADKYDPNYENKAEFITYAVYWINQRIYRYLNYNNRLDEKSLNSPVGEDNDSELIEYIEGVDYGFENVDEKLYIEGLRKELETVMNNNNTLKEQEVLKMRYGWYGNKRMKLEDIAEVFDINRERVRQIENRAIRKIRKSMWFRIEFEKRYQEKKVRSINSIYDVEEFMDWVL